MSSVITTERLSLRPFTLDDAAHVSRMAGQLCVARMVISVPSPYPVLAAEGWILTHDSLRRRSEAFPCAIEHPSDGMVGAAGLHHTPAGWILGYWIGKPFQGRGYASEAASAMIGYAEAELSLPRVGAEWFEDNPASGRVLEKAGFRPTGQTTERFSLGRCARARAVGMEWRSGAAH